MFKFMNLLGPAYRGYNIEFANENARAKDFTLLTPVGNRIHIQELLSNVGSTLPVESSANFKHISVSPNGRLVIACNAIGEVYVISLVSRSVLNILRPGGLLQLLEFSPDGSMFAVYNERSHVVTVYNVPGDRPVPNPFEKHRTITNLNKVVHLSWSPDSRLLIITTRVGMIEIYPMQKFTNFKSVRLSGSTNLLYTPGMCSFFYMDYDFFSVDAHGAIRIWKCSLRPYDFIEEVENPPLYPYYKPSPMKKLKIDGEPEEPLAESDLVRFYKDGTDLYFSKFELFEEKKARPAITAIDYCSDKALLVAGFGTLFALVEMPDFNLIQTLQLSQSASISTIKLDKTGEWIALGFGEIEQLTVYNWQSQNHIMKQEGHRDIIESFGFSCDSAQLVTGGVDGKLKIWDVRSGHCVKTFDSEHTAAITGALFTSKPNTVVSSSMDGTVRAFDTKRYRNFKTFVTPRPAQFYCLAVDSAGTFVAAGSDDFNIYIWSMGTGMIINTLSGHAGLVNSIAFSPASLSTQLVSVSFDKTIRMWDAVQSDNREMIQLSSEGTAIAFAPNGEEFVVSTLDGDMQFYNKEGTQKGSVDGRQHLSAGRAPSDKITASKSHQSKQFRTLAYSPDGQLLLAGGAAVNVCLYNVEMQHLINTFPVTNNQSYSSIKAFVHHKQYTDFGNKALIEDRDDANKLNLPGVRKGDMAARTYTDEIRVTCVRFAPDGKTWGAATPEGLLLYSSDLVNVFDPIDADEDVTPVAVKNAKESGQFDVALMLALRLNMDEHIRDVMECVPYGFIDLFVTRLPYKYIPLLLAFLPKELSKTRRLEFYMRWASEIMLNNLSDIRRNIDTLMPQLNALSSVIDLVDKNIAMLVNANLNKIGFIKTRLDANSKIKTEVKIEGFDFSSADENDSDVHMHEDVED